MLSKLYSWYGKRTVWSVAAVILLLIGVGVIIKLTSNGTEEQNDVVPIVKVATVAELSGSETITLLGTVRSVSEAAIQSEVAGRVTGVPVSLGEEVGAGAVIATLENAAERAAVLQAEGAYEAALASASVGDLSVAQAQTSLTAAQNAALNSIQSSYTTVSNSFFTAIDDLYNDPNSPLTSPRIFDNNRQFLSAERVAFQKILPAWQESIATLQPTDDLANEINESLTHTTRTKNLVDNFLSILQERDDQTFNGESAASIINTFNGLRTSLDNIIISLESAQTTLTNAEDALAQAEVGGTNSDLSAANAQVKQALGSLRAAQARLADTIIRTPIAGTVNDLDVNVGDFLGSFQSVAKVANNDALEVTVFVGDTDRAAIAVGDEVQIEGMYTGTVTNIGAGIDSDTQKTEVKIATETSNLTNGDTVSVALTQADENNGDAMIVLPISAIKFTADSGFVLTVENGVVTEHPVTIGAVRGGFVEVTDGITPEMQVIVDARGLNTGAKVEAN